MHGLKEAKDCIKKARTIAVASHINPDGDSIGSLLALGLGLEKLGKEVYMVSRDGVPVRYRALPGARRVSRYLGKKVDLAISVDCSNKEILGDTYESFRLADAFLEIDHHDFRRPFGDVAFVDNKAAAVGELIYILLKELNVSITGAVAQNLMTSIVVETNSFGLPSVRAHTFEVCMDLLAMGMDFHKLVDIVFWSRRKESAILSGLCMSRCRFMKDGKVVWSFIGKEDFKRVGGKDEDVDSVPDEMRSIKNTRIALLFREKDGDSLRVSLRSKGKLNVAGVAEYYNGGGHFDVAGCTIPNDEKYIKDLLDRAARLLKKGVKA